ncbi:tetratricopeptide repeat protein [Herbidospora cretacea]|uniref:tetratricopeptide repeat protein n=1 Tax=Herbidospora cretacea TaxID=28444 RepID=UPI00077459D8|nr:tetratricopeptide repeat protein [Herbidospora cretacea]
MLAQERRLAAIAAASAAAFRHSDYHQVRAEDVAERVRLPRGGEKDTGRSAVWLYNEVRSRRVLVALAAKHAFDEFTSGESAAGPVTSMLGAAESVAAALRRIARFHQVERFLLAQVRLGIGDISTSEKRPSAAQTPPVWLTGTYGSAAAAGWEGRVTAYAEYLAPRLDQAARAVAVPPGNWAKESAERLSELAFRAMSDDTDAPADRQAEGLAAYWLARDLIPLTGEWADRLHAAERTAELVEKIGPNGRSRANALVVVFQVLLDSSPLLARAAEVGAELAPLLNTSPADGLTLCDVTSRRGLALLRLGDTAGARACFEESRRLAEKLPDSADPASLIARAEHNLAELLVDEGRPEQGRRLLADVAGRRGNGVPKAGAGPEWRRHTLTRQALARATVRAGRVVEGVTLAEATLADREERLGSDNVNTASARVTLAESLLAAAHPAQARHHLTEAMRLRALYLPGEGYWPQYDLVRLAEIELHAGFPAQAVRLLDEATVTTTWFAERVSPRLHEEAVLVRSLGLTASGEALTAINDLAELPQSRAVLRALAEARLTVGDPATAARVLDGLTEEESAPDRAETLLLRARACAALGREAAAEEAWRAVLAMGDDRLDPTHPTVLGARLGLALQRVRSDRAAEVGDLLAPLLDRRVLAHGKPALGDGHPLLAEAMSLAARAGTPPARTPEDQLWENF